MIWISSDFEEISHIATCIYRNLVMYAHSIGPWTFALCYGRVDEWRGTKVMERVKMTAELMPRLRLPIEDHWKHLRRMWSGFMFRPPTIGFNLDYFTGPLRKSKVFK